MAPVAHNLLSRSQPGWPAVSQPFATFHNLGARPVAEHAPTEIHNLKKLDIETPERGRRHRGDGPSPYAREALICPCSANAP